jgi:hypothetical protein
VSTVTAAELSMAERFRYFLRTTWVVLRRSKLRRNTSSVTTEYSDGWSAYRQHLERTESLAHWLRLPGVDDLPAMCNVDGRLSYQAFDSLGYYREVLLDALTRHFPEAKSITEYGAGLGRNLMFLKQVIPDLEAHGYELCAPGVELGNAAARKFGVDVRFAQLDYLKDPPEKFTFPRTDVGFTMFSLEQLPRDSGWAVANMLRRVGLGTIHIEPVPENYPKTFRGLLGRVDHWKVDYLSGFDKAVRALDLREVIVEPLSSAHNPLMFPSLYVLKKK